MRKRSNIQTKKSNDEKKFIEELIAETVADFNRRRKERLSYERQWELNLNFLRGNQYVKLNNRGEIIAEDKGYLWQNRGVFNHIAPIMESRAAKFSRVTPNIYVRPKSDDDEDVSNASVAEKLIEEAFKKTGIEEVVRQTTSWSESCGTGFYKIIWNNQSGKVLGELDGNDVFEGDADVISVSPFEIFPDNLCTEKLDAQRSIIHAKAMPVSVIREKYGVEIAGEEIDVFDLSPYSAAALNNRSKKCLSDAAVVIEKYEAPSTVYPEGRLITVSGGKLLYYGVLPYNSTSDGKKRYPFVKQESCVVSGSFFGSSIIERLIPVQRAYNAVKNRKHEFLNRISNGVLTVEDGSVDIDDLSEDGLSPGKVLVYRQGCKPPEVMAEASVPSDFSDEETKLLNEFVIISGVSDVASSNQNAKVSSGTALELLIEQDNERLTLNAEIIRKCYLEISRHILWLYQQFVKGVRAVKSVDGFDKTRIYYANKNTAFSDDVYLESENELMFTPAQKKEVIFDLYKSGLLFGDDGKLNSSTKEKVLSLLGYKDLDYQKGLARLHEEKAQNENKTIRFRGLDAENIDDHKIHIDEHTRYVLSEYDELTAAEKERLLSHIKEHQDKLKEKYKTED